MASGRTTYDVLGPLRVLDHSGADITPSGMLQKRLLAALLLDRGEVVSADRLVESMWGDGSAPAGSAPLHSHLFRLRQRIPTIDVEHRPPGYVLHVDRDAIDLSTFEQLVADARDRRASDPAEALALLDRALGLWRGRPFDELIDTDEGMIESERLTELRSRALEERFAALHDLGRAAESIGDLEAFVAREPLRERPRQLLMGALAASGRRVEALRVYDDYRRLLAEEVGVAPSPELRRRHDALLALDETEPEPEPGETSAPEPGTARPRSERVRTSGELPPRPISTFVGRDDLVADITSRLADVRLLTLLGPGGVGKTRIATEIVHTCADRFPDGVEFCDLSTIGVGGDDLDAIGVGLAVCAASRIEPRADTHPADRLADVWRSARFLLVVDNCEHVLDGAAELIERLLGATEHLTVLATSRERLAVDGEVLCPVEPLGCAADGGHSPAAQMFLDRARAVVPDLDPVDEPLIGELCAKLDGLPLALEIAATRLRSLTLREICDGVDHSMKVLHGGRRTVPRHRSLAAALDWSYQLLDEHERATLQAAAVFRAPFDAADLGAVIGCPTDEARERLAELVERSLVSRVGDRYRLLQTIRRFTHDRTAADVAARCRGAHAQRMTERVEEASRRLRTDDNPTSISLVRRLVPELRQARETAIDLADAELAVRLVIACRDPAMDGMLPELMMWGEDVAELAVSADHPSAADALAIAALGRWKVGDLEATRRLLDRCTAEVERLACGDRYEVLSSLGVEDLAQGRIDRAIERLRRAIATTDAVDDVHRSAEGGATLAICLGYAHRSEAADVVDWLLADVAPRSGAVPAAWCWYGAGECALDAAPDEARTHLERAVELARDGGATFVEGVARTSLASLAVRSGRVDEAVEHYEWLLPLWLRAGVRTPLWTMLRAVVELLANEGLDEPAARLLAAIQSTDAGHEVAGDDARRLGAIEATLSDRLDAERFERCVAEGRRFDDAAAAAEATAAFARFG